MARVFAGLFAPMPPAVFVVVGLALLTVTLWLTHLAWHSYRVVSAVANAPLADLRSPSAGLIKLRGTAEPPPAPAGQPASSIVWYSRSSRSGSNSSTLTTTQNFLIRDEHGACGVETARAEIVPTRSVSDHAFLDRSRTTSEQVIHAGDPVFAVGELRRDLPALAGLPDGHCQLSRSRGVLLVGGSTERYVTVLYVLWASVYSLLGLLCFGVLAVGAWAHVSSYPPTAGSAVRTFFDSLRATPLKSEAGLQHPLWDQIEKDERKSGPRSD